MSVRVITKETYHAEQLDTQVGGLMFPNKYYDCSRYVDKKELRQSLALPKGSRIYAVLTIMMDDPEYENVVNEKICYTTPLIGDSTQAGAYEVIAPNGKAYWLVDNPTGNAIVVVTLRKA
jgi:hypothetical protein